MPGRSSPLSSVPAERPAPVRRIIIVDDSVVARAALSRAFESEVGFAVVAAFDRAERALAWLETHGCDLVLLDLDLPGRGGIAALPDLILASGSARVVVVSSSAEEGAAATLTALALGAADAIAKPGSGSLGRAFGAALVERVRGIVGDGGGEPVRAPVVALRDAPSAPLELVAIGASTGGIHAITRLLSGLPRGFDVPIVITQHLPQPFLPFFAAQVATQTRRRVRVAQAGDAVSRGTILVAPGEAHLTLVRKGDAVSVALCDRPAAARCMPAVDPMLASAGLAYGAGAVGIVLSGMGRDGAAGAQVLAEHGGALIVQDAESSTIWGMPGSIARAGLASLIAPPERIAAYLARRGGAL